LGIGLYVLLLDAPLWLPSFLALYWAVRHGPRARRIALALLVPAVLLLFVGPWAPERDAGSILLVVLVGGALGALMGLWQRRIASR